MATFIDKWNDKQLNELELEIEDLYKEAIKETQEKAEVYFNRIEKITKNKLEDLANGKITQAEYDSYLRGVIFQKDRFNAFISEYQNMINQYDAKALDIVSAKTPNVFATNGNYVAYHLETGQKLDFNFQLWDKGAVERLMKEDVTLLPPRKLSIPKNNAWNMKAVKRQLTQAILQGNSIPTYAKRLQTVTGMNKNNAVRNARTSMTTAQNASRQKRMEEAEDLGLIIKKTWIATKDSRTRQEHRELDGQTIGVREAFEHDGDTIKYPGDVKALPSNLWRCRCTMVEKYEGITGAAEQRKLDTMKTDEYKAWKGAVEKGEVYELPKENVSSEDFNKIISDREKVKKELENKMLFGGDGIDELKTEYDKLTSQIDEIVQNKQVGLDDVFLNQKIDENNLINLTNSTITQEERFALSTWSGSDYTYINQYMRFGDSNRPEIIEASKQISNALEAKTTQEMVLRRGTDERAIGILFGDEKWKDNLSDFTGTVIYDKGFLATTPFDGGGFGGTVKMFIEAPKGTKGLYIKEIAKSKEEREFLLQANTKIVVTEIKEFINEYDNKEYHIMGAIINE